MGTVSRKKDFRIQKAVEFLSKDPSCTLPDLAHCCGISMSRLSHLFKDETGLTVKNYRLDQRLDLAAEMLASTDLPIKEIAYAAGYHHTSSFARAFKTHFSLSPNRYRRQHRWQVAA